MCVGWLQIFISLSYTIKLGKGKHVFCVKRKVKRSISWHVCGKSKINDDLYLQVDTPSRSLCDRMSICVCMYAVEALMLAVAKKKQILFFFYLNTIDSLFMLNINIIRISLSMHNFYLASARAWNWKKAMKITNKLLNTSPRHNYLMLIC